MKKFPRKSENKRKKVKKVGLITGCFDVLHFEHIQLFRFAKRHVDFLVVGLDNDVSISISKGKNKPINPIEQRLQSVFEPRSVDMVFEIKEIFRYSDGNKADKVHMDILGLVNSDYLITAVEADRFWKDKKGV